MKTLRLSLLLVLLAACVMPAALANNEPAGNTPKPSLPNPFAARFKQVRERIDALFGNRNETPPAPDPRANPFRVPGAPIGVTSRSEEASAIPDVASNSSLLERSAAALRVSGVFEIGGRSHLVINARPYKEGDVVQTQVQGEAVYLRVREISKRSVTLELHDVELTLKF